MSRSAPPHRALYEALPVHVLGAVDHDRLAPLVDPGARARAAAVLGELAVPVHTVCYECRLAADDPRVDVAVALFPAPAADPAGVLGALGRRHGDEPIWQRCLALLGSWSSPRPATSPASPASLITGERVPFICVAFDQPGASAAPGGATAPGAPVTLPAPALSLCIDPDLFARQLGLPAPPPAPPSQIAALAGACAGPLRGAPLPAPCRAAIERCLADDRVLARHISFMVSRRPATFKLDVRLPADRVASLLRRIAWPGDIPRVAAGIAALVPWRGHVQLNLVLDPAPDPRAAAAAGLEVELLAGPREASPADRMALLDALVAAGHCAPAKAAVLRDAWTHPVSRAADGLIVARSWYLKVCFAGDRIAGTKAYLGLMPRVLDGRVAAVAPGAPATSPMSPG